MKKNSTTLFLILRDVVQQLKNVVCPNETIKIVKPLREYVAPNSYVGIKDLSYNENLEWYAGQLLNIVDKQAWHAMNITLDFFSVVESEKENQQL